MNKRVLIITYYWPPSGGSGVQRWLKFAKYLPEYGWDPVIYTPVRKDMDVTDESLLGEVSPATEVLRSRIVEPYRMYKLLVSRKAPQAVHPIDSQEKSFKQKVSLWIRANLFIPDPKYTWIKPSVKILSKYLAEHPVDVIVTTGPPHSLHLIGLSLVRELKKKGLDCPKWIADFRDDWTGYYGFKYLPFTKYARNKHLSLEQSVLDQADDIITVTPSSQAECQARTSTPVHLITNGYDVTDMSTEAAPTYDKFSLVYTGIFPADANPMALWQVLAHKASMDPIFSQKLEIRLCGITDPAVLRSLRDSQLWGNTVVLGYRQHADAIREMQGAHLLLLALSREEESRKVLLGKTYEYIASGRPILSVCQRDSDTAAYLERYNAGVVCPWDDEDGMERVIDGLWQDFLDKKSAERCVDTREICREELTRKLVEVMQ